MYILKGGEKMDDVSGFYRGHGSLTAWGGIKQYNMSILRFLSDLPIMNLGWCHITLPSLRNTC